LVTLTPLKTLWSWLVSWLVPEGVLLAAAVVALQNDRFDETVRAVAQGYPYAVFAVGLLLALRFQRSRLAFALLVLSLAEWVVAAGPGGVAGRAVFQATALLLPLNLAAIALMTDRGLVTRMGIARLVVLALQVAAVMFLAHHHAERVAAFLGQPFLPAAWFDWTPLAQIPFFASLAALALIAVAMFLQAAPAGRSFLWALAAAFLGVHAGRSGVAHTIYLATAGLILVIAVVEASYQMAYKDGLTGLPARRALNEALQRLSGRYSVAMVDVDHFKKLNDRFGHDVGDQVLKMVAARLAKAPGGGRAFRYGGEEFALLFPGRTVEECLPDLETLRQDVADAGFTIRRRIRPRRRPTTVKEVRTRERVAVTVSIGVAEPNGRRKTPEQVIQAADQALYRAKDAGRNRVMGAGG
jgi:diguanylate cyclase (GGDEF)-like protein